MSDTIIPDTYPELETEAYLSVEPEEERDTVPPPVSDSQRPTRPAPAYMACRAAAMPRNSPEQEAPTHRAPPRALLRLPKIPRPSKVPQDLMYRAPETFTAEDWKRMGR